MLLIYNIDALDFEDSQSFMGFLNKINEPWRQLGAGDLEITVEALLHDGQGQLNKGPDNPPDVTFLLMDGDDALVDRVLEGLRAFKVDLPYKAVVTETNRSWLLGDLLQHIIDEDREVRALTKLQRMMATAGAFNADDYLPEAWGDYMDARAHAEDILARAKNHDMTPDEAEEAVNRFNQSVLNLLGQGV